MDIVAELKAAFENFKTENNEAMTAVNAMIEEQKKGNEQGVSEVVAKAEEITKNVQGNADRLVELEQKLVDGIQKGTESPKSLGQLVIEDDIYKRFASGESEKCRIVLAKDFDVRNNTITGQSGSPAENNNTLTPAQRIPGIIPGAFQRLRAKDLIPQGTTISNAIEATRELAFTNSAAETAENAKKPESTLTFELINVPVRTIAHFLKVSKQVRDDAPMLMSYINTRLAYGVDLKEDAQIIVGDGTGQNLEGMTLAANRSAFTPLSGYNRLDSINYGKQLIDAAGYMATGVMLNPADWGAIERTKVGSSDARYIVGDPRSAMGPYLWGLPVIVSPNVPSGYFAIAAFDIAFMYFKRQETTVEIFEQDEDNAQYNLLTVRAEKRCALVGQRPASVYYGALTL